MTVIDEMLMLQHVKHLYIRSARIYPPDHTGTRYVKLDLVSIGTPTRVHTMATIFPDGYILCKSDSKQSISSQARQEILAQTQRITKYLIDTLGKF